MKFLATLLVTIFLFSSCAKLPVEAVQLMEGVSKEGERMHKLNMALLNNLLVNKKQAINEHVRIFQKRQIDLILATIKGQGVDMNKPDELTGFFTELKNYINNYEDSLVITLQKGYDQYAEKLRDDYLQYQQACTAMKNLLSSAVKVNKARRDMLQQVLNLSGSKTDIQQFENLIDDYIIRSGSAAEKGISFLKNVNSFLKN